MAMITAKNVRVERHCARVVKRQNYEEINRTPGVIGTSRSTRTKTAYKGTEIRLSINIYNKK